MREAIGATDSVVTKGKIVSIAFGSSMEIEHGER